MDLEQRDTTETDRPGRAAGLANVHRAAASTGGSTGSGASTRGAEKAVSRARPTTISASFQLLSLILAILREHRDTVHCRNGCARFGIGIRLARPSSHATEGRPTYRLKTHGTSHLDKVGGFRIARPAHGKAASLAQVPTTIVGRMDAEGHSRAIRDMMSSLDTREPG